jgi:hypothetical protein
VVAFVTVRVVVPEALEVSSAGVVGAKAAVRELAATGSVAVTRVALPELTATGLPSATPPFLKVTLPAAAGEMVAVSVTLAP